MNVWLTLIVAVLAGFFGTGFYLWIRAEIDERRWRRIIEREEERLIERLKEDGEL